jgi:cell division protease FtsH
MPSGALKPSKKNTEMDLSHKKILLSIMIGFMLIMLFRGFNEPGSIPEISYSDFLKMVESGSVIRVTLQGSNISGLNAQGVFHTYAPEDPGLMKLLKNNGVKLSAEPVTGDPWYWVIIRWGPMLLMIGVWIYFMRRMQGGRWKPAVLWKKQSKSHVGFTEESHIRRCGGN